MDKKPSGHEFRQRRKREAEEAAARERDRTGLTANLKQRIAEIRVQPMDALGNQTFANNVARVLAEALLDDDTLPLEQKSKLVGEQLDRIAATHSKAINSERIRALQNKAGVTKVAKPDAARVVPVGAGSTVRAGSRLQRRVQVSGPLPDVSSEEDGRGTAEGGRSVGQPPEEVH